MFKIGFIGAGQVNFGGGEGPWDHATRLERLYTDKAFTFLIVGIADLDLPRAKSVLQQRSSKHPTLYHNCQIFERWQDMIEQISDLTTVIIGTPPHARGSLAYDKDIELQCVKQGLDVFVEKPVSADTPEEFQKYVEKINREQDAYSVVGNTKRRCRYYQGNPRAPIVSVGYMFRYHAALQRMKEIIDSKPYYQPILHVNLRYQCAYEYLDSKKLFWWDERLSGGPIVEQATHFVDLARYLTGDIQSTNTLMVNATLVGDDKENKKNTKYPLIALDEKINEADIPNQYKNPLVTSAHWKSTHGTIVSLTHAIHLHHQRYESQIDVWCDGLWLSLVNPYAKVTKLHVREGSGNKGEPCKEYTLEFDNDKPEYDPYYQELYAFFRGCEQNDNTKAKKWIRSSYTDAAKTYALTWDIRRKSKKQEKSKL